MSVLAVIGWVLLGLLALLVLALLLPVGASVDYRDGVLRARVLLGPFSREIAGPRADKRAAKRARKQAKQARKATPQKKKPATSEKKEKQKQPFSQRLESLRQLLRASKKALRTLARHLVIDRLQLRLHIGSEDAHRTALGYAKVSAALAVALEVLDALFTLRSPSVSVRPDWVGGGTRVELGTVRIRIRPLFLVKAGLHVLAAVLRLPKAKSDQQLVNHKRNKGGKKHEPTTSHR